ncbi:MAG: hypothetical protein QF609_08160 [Gammaproteobacteria bacterium]|jgi:hypothetical protein|nr:hypothetical protein [Gammaproteobacteria bacterium]
MSDTTILAGAMAVIIIMVFLVRFYRRQIAPGIGQRRWTQTLGGLAVIVGSILLSIWLRKNT